MTRIGPPPRARIRWVITCALLILVFTVGNLIVFHVSCSAVSSTPYGISIAFVLAIVWAGMLVSHKKRNRDDPHTCDHCGWRLRPKGARQCRICGAYQRRYCDTCGYDLTGNVSGVCPECGTAVQGVEN
jgi:hypothetical protein